MKTTRHEERKATERLHRAITGRRPLATKAAAALLIVAGAAGWSAPSSAQATIGTELRLAELEKAFWVCDHAATIGLIDGSTAITCGSLTEALKQRKFDGDFNAMLAWWREHKNAEHLALAQAGGTSIPRRAPTTPQ
jgi:hypothetical protein